MMDIYCKNCGKEIEDILLSWEDDFCSEECYEEYTKPDDNDIGCVKFHETQQELQEK